MAPNQPGPADPCPMTPLWPVRQIIPTAINQYRLLRTLGWGGAGIVFEADDTRLLRKVAVKLIPNEPAPVMTPLRILREAQLASQVRHPNVVSLFDSGTYAGGVFLAMELVEGQSMQTFLRDGPLPWHDATAVAFAACEGLAAVHDCGIIHRDVTPANLLRTADGTVKLTDFGLARRLDPLGLSATWMRMAGTPHYMSPEQCRAEKCDERTDIYSLGATYHALLTGGTPYSGATPLRIMFEHCSAPVPDLRKASPEIPAACAGIVARAMAKKRAGRYDSAREMQNALRAVLLERPTA